jgi:hypothetical protein
MGWAHYVVSMGEMRNAYCILARKPELLGDISIDSKIILDWILGKYCGMVCTGCIWFRIGTNGRLL